MFTEINGCQNFKDVNDEMLFLRWDGSHFLCGSDYDHMKLTWEQSEALITKWQSMVYAVKALQETGRKETMVQVPDAIAREIEDWKGSKMPPRGAEKLVDELIPPVANVLGSNVIRSKTMGFEVGEEREIEVVECEGAKGAFSFSLPPLNPAGDYVAGPVYEREGKRYCKVRLERRFPDAASDPIELEAKEEMDTYGRKANVVHIPPEINGRYCFGPFHVRESDGKMVVRLIPTEEGGYLIKHGNIVESDLLSRHLAAQGIKMPPREPEKLVDDLIPPVANVLGSNMVTEAIEPKCTAKTSLPEGVTEVEVQVYEENGIFSTALPAEAMADVMQGRYVVGSPPYMRGDGKTVVQVRQSLSIPPEEEKPLMAGMRPCPELAEANKEALAQLLEDAVEHRSKSMLMLTREECSEMHKVIRNVLMTYTQWQAFTKVIEFSKGE